MLNTIAIMGRLTHTPELRTTTSGKEVCSFDIACERSYSANGQRETDLSPVWRGARRRSSSPSISTRAA